MKLLKQYSSISDAECAAKKLEDRGILTHVSSKQSKALSAQKTGAFHVGLWSVLEHQNYDAISFLQNSKHEITSALSKEELIQLKQQAKTSSFKTINRLLVYAFSGITCIIIIVILAVTFMAGSGV